MGIIYSGDIMLYIILVSVFAYLFGSVSTAVIISKALFKSDIRNYGSNNAGATNVLRTFGKKAGVIVFFLDFLKGLLAVSVARCLVLLFDAPYECILFAGFFSQLGHIFPVFFKFRGGKGVATAAGAALGIMPFTALILFAVFAIITAITKTVSLASSVCAVLYPVLAYFISDKNKDLIFVYAAACAVLIVLKHIPNIIRIIDGNENKISSDRNKK